MKKFLLIPLLLAGVTAAAQTITVKDTVMTTYDYSDPDPVARTDRVYPYTRYNQFSQKPVQKTWKMVVLYSGCEAFFSSRYFSSSVTSKLSFMKTSQSVRFGIRCAMTVCSPGTSLTQRPSRRSPRRLFFSSLIVSTSVLFSLGC